VWVGNFTGEGNPNIYGARAAGPVFFDIFRALPKKSQKLWFTKPDSAYEDVMLCAVTGYAVSSDCPDTVAGEKVRNEKIFTQCPYHKKIFLNKARTEQVCSYCWNPNDYIEEYRAVFPAEVAHYMALNGESSYILPPHRKSRPLLMNNDFIDIIYPVASAIIKLPRDSDGKLEKLVLRAAYNGQDAELFWYLDDKFLGTTISAKKTAANTHNLALDIDPGKHKLTILDSDGNVKSVKFSIEKK